MSLQAGRMGGMRVYFLVGAMVYLVPGTLYILCSIYLGRRQFWAVVGGLVLAAIQLLFVVIALGGFLFALSFTEDGRSIPVFIYVYLALLAFVALALVQLIYHLIQSFEAIKHPPPGEETRGFEPIAVRPITGDPAMTPQIVPIQTGAAPAGNANEHPPH
jgi:hypothetical protein